MALPININELRTGRAVECGRIEFKKGWIPICVLHTICRFTNDLIVQYIERKIEEGQERD